MSAETMSLKNLLRKLDGLSRTQILLLTCAVTLLPMVVGLLLWGRMPDAIPLYLDTDGRSDAMFPKLLAVFLPPAVLLLCHILTFLFLGEKHSKLSDLAFWILPIMANLISYMTYALAIGAQYPLLSYVQLFLGLLLAFVGSRLPKIKPNSTWGFRVPWALTSRHNWWATHRVGGYSFAAGGLCIILAAFLPREDSLNILLGIFLVILAVPAAFSFVYYMRQKAKGEPLHRLPKPGKGALLLLICALICIAVLLCTGELRYDFRNDHMLIRASYYDDFTVPYADIDEIELIDGDMDGSRVGGYLSLRLQMGYYHIEETETTYTRYTYANPDSCILLMLRGRPLVISGKTNMETHKLYEQLLEKMEN